MKIKKIETNYNRNLFFSESNVSSKKYSEKIQNQVINVYPDYEFQEILGFGGALTEAAAYSIFCLPQNKKIELLKEYFSKEGNNYNLIRLSIGSSDFSLSSYSYANKHDLSDFSIEHEFKYLIPLIKEIQKINPQIKFLASPWSPPKFMKSTKLLTLGGKLLEKYYQTWANYLVKYVQEFEKNEISIDYMTVQNEPNAIQIWESCLYSAEDEISFVTKYLYPTFKENHISTKILIWDHNKEKLFTRAKQELSTQEALQAVSGIAFHYYTGDHFENISLTSHSFPGKLLIHTEGCTGYSNFNPNDEIHNGELYGHEILGDLTHNANAYIDWNLVLDNNGGPNHKHNYCNSPIMLNKNSTDYIKNLTFYYIKHFSKYITSGAKRIATSAYSSAIEVAAFKNPDNSILVVLLNRNNFNKEYNLCIDDIYLHDNLDKHAIVTYIIQQDK